MKHLIRTLLLLAVTSEAAWAQIPTQGLVAYYQFNGNANDQTGHGYSGVPHGVNLVSDRFGNPNAAYYFPGDSSYIDLPTLSFPTILNTGTVSCWIRVDTVDGQYATVMAKSTFVTDIRESEIFISPDERVIYYSKAINDGGYPESATDVARETMAQAIHTGYWFHIALVSDGINDLAFYVNGQLTASEPRVQNSGFRFFDYGTSWVIGKFFRAGYNPGTDYFHGAIDDIALYDRALSAAGIDSLFHDSGWIAPNYPPNPPRGLTANRQPGQVTLVWNRNLESDFLRYRVYESTSPHPTQIVDSTSGGITDTTVTLTGLANGTSYYFRLTAVDSAGLESGFSNEVSVSPPNAPTGLMATPQANSVSLAWNGNNAGYILRYRIYSGTTPDPTAVIDSTSGGLTDTTRTILGLSNGTPYYFRLTAVDSGGAESPFSNQVSATPEAAWAQIPTQGLVAYYQFNGNADDQTGHGYSGVPHGVNLVSDRFGNPNSAYYFPGDSSYIDLPTLVFPSVSNTGTVSCWIKVDTVVDEWGGVMTKSTFQTNIRMSDVFISPDSRVVYKSKHYNDGSLGESATDVGRQTMAQAIQTGQWFHIALVSDGVNDLQIYVNNRLSATQAYDANNSGSRFFDYGTSWVIGKFFRNQDNPGTDYFHGAIDDIALYDRALSVAGIDSLFRHNGWIAPNYPPNPPRGLTANRQPGQVTLVWNRNTESDFLRYRVYESTSPHPTTVVDSTFGITDTTITLTGLINGTSYYFRLTAVDSAGLESGFSNEVSATPHLPGAVTLRVPLQFSTIQSAIDAAADFDTVLIAPGTYIGNGNRDVSFEGKRILVTSLAGPTSTIIDCQGDSLNNHRGFYFHSGEDSSSVLSGFTIRNGSEGDIGGGVLIENSSPVINNVRIANNVAGLGGGLYCSSGAPRLVHCVISANSSIGGNPAGGGFYLDNSSSIFDSCSVDSNSCPSSPATGGGGLISQGHPTFVGCKFLSNSVGASATTGNQCYGGGVECVGGRATFSQCLFEGNVAGNPQYPFWSHGGALYIGNDTVTLSMCSFLNNATSSQVGTTTLAGHTIYNSAGGALYCITGSTIVIIDTCFFERNESWVGGAVSSNPNGPQATQIILNGCTIVENTADSLGSALYIGAGAQFNILNSIVAFNRGTGAAYVARTSSVPTGTRDGMDANDPVAVRQSRRMKTVSTQATKPQAIRSAASPAVQTSFSCTDIYGNAGGNWTDSIAIFEHMNGNMSLNPEFCDTTNGNFQVDSLSPCAPTSPLNGCGTLIGALGLYCRHCTDANHDGICDDIYQGACNCQMASAAPRQNDSLMSLTQFTWTSNCSANSYKVVLAGDSALQNVLWTSTVVSSPATYSGTALGGNRSYFWSVSASCGGSWKPYAPAISFYLKSPADSLPAPTLMYPKAVDTIGLPSTFSWTAVTGAKGYVLQLSHSSLFDTVLSALSASGTSVSVPQLAGLPVGQTAYWRAAAIDTLNNTGKWSLVRTFKVKSSVQVPPTPLTYPPDFAITDSVVLRWSTTSGASCCNVQFSTDSSYASQTSTWTRQVCGDTATTIARPSSNIYWRVQACNTAGCSSWGNGSAGSSCCGGSGTTVCIATPVINVNSDTLTVEQGNSVSLNGSLPVTCSAHVTGGWYINDTALSSFDLGTISNTVASVTSPNLPTATIRNYKVTLKGTIGATTLVSRELNVVINPPTYGTPSALLVKANPTSLFADSVSTSQITIQVVDQSFKLVGSDNGRSVNLTIISGPGLLDNSSGTTSGGTVIFTYRSGITSDSVVLRASSGDLTPGFVTLYLTGTPLTQMRSRFSAQMSVMDSLRLHQAPGEPRLTRQYTTTSLWNFYNSRINIGSPTTADTTAFHRLILALDLVLQNYYHGQQPLYPFDNDFTSTYSQEGAVTDAVRGVQEYSTPVLAAANIGFAAVPNLPAPAQSAAYASLSNILTRLSDNLNNVVLGLPTYPQQAFKGADDYVVNSIKTNLDAGQAASVSVIDSGIQQGASDLALTQYVSGSQFVVDSISYWTLSNQSGGSYLLAKQQTDSLLQLLKGNGSVIEQQFDQLGLLQSSAGYLNNLTNLDNDPFNRLTTVYAVTDNVLSDTNYISGVTAVGSYCGRINSDLLGLVGRSFPPDSLTHPNTAASARDKRTTIIASKTASASLAPVNTSLVDTYLKLTGDANQDYQTQLRAIQDEIKNHDYSGLSALLVSLASKNHDITSLFSGNVGIIRSTSSTAKYQVPSYNQLFANLYKDYQGSGRNRDLFDFWAAYFSYDTTNASLRLQVINQADLAANQTQTAQSEFSDLFGRIYTLTGTPSLIVSQMNLPSGSLSANAQYNLSATVKNNGAGTALNSYVKLVGDTRLAVTSADSVFIGSVPSGDSNTVQFQLKFLKLSQDSGKTSVWSSISAVPGASNGIAAVNSIAVKYTLSCCVGKRGNVNCTGVVDLGDLSALVSYLTGGGFKLCCADAADVNGMGVIDLGDLSALVSYLTGGGFVLPSCPVGLSTSTQPAQRETTTSARRKLSK